MRTIGSLVLERPPRNWEGRFVEAASGRDGLSGSAGGTCAKTSGARKVASAAGARYLQKRESFNIGFPGMLGAHCQMSGDFALAGKPRLGRRGRCPGHLVKGFAFKYN